jgi:hypothetical protein
MSKIMITRELIETFKFRPFTGLDFQAFSGVSSPVPMIAENDDEGMLMIIDGDAAELYFYDGCANFELMDTCENIRSLPYKSARELEIERRIKNLKEELAALENELCY